VKKLRVSSVQGLSGIESLGRGEKTGNGLDTIFKIPGGEKHSNQSLTTKNRVQVFTVVMEEPGEKEGIFDSNYRNRPMQ